MVEGDKLTPAASAIFYFVEDCKIVHNRRIDLILSFDVYGGALHTFML
jgi:hypothetical protein